MDIQRQLIDKYSNQSKHSNYQTLPASLQNIIPASSVVTNSRWERERLEFIKQSTNLKNAKILDVGGNTGFFSFETLEAGANHVDYFDGNKEHADFVKLAAEALGCQDKISVHGKYFDFDNPGTERYDVGLLLNVLHHSGSDYGEESSDTSVAKKAIVDQLNSMSRIANVLIFQLGFNWHGDPKKSIFQNGTKTEMISFIKTGVKNHWAIQCIGIAQKNNDRVAYFEMNERNVVRDDSLGEFLNRPLFILNSKN